MFIIETFMLIINAGGVKMTFGERLKLLRDEKGLTQEQIGEIINVARPTVAGYETKGKQPDHDKLNKLADYFNVSTDYLLCRTNERNPKKTVNLDDVEVWFHKTDGYKDLPEQAQKELSDYISYLRHKYGKKE